MHSPDGYQMHINQVSLDLHTMKVGHYDQSSIGRLQSKGRKNAVSAKHQSQWASCLFQLCQIVLQSLYVCVIQAQCECGPLPVGAGTAGLSAVSVRTLFAGSERAGGI